MVKIPSLLTDPTLIRVTELRAALWAAGFRPVALVTDDKMPRTQNWPDRARCDPPADAAEIARPGHTNTGLLCDGLRVLDLDIDGSDILGGVRALALEVLGNDPLIRTRSNSPRCALMYRAAAGSPGKRSIVGTLGKVEVLGHGQQVHAFGPHPSGGDLQWHPTSPGQATLDNLPKVTEDQITAFLAAATPLLQVQIMISETDRGRPGSPEGYEHSRADPEADPLDIAAALAVIPNGSPADWEAWNNVGMAVWSATSGSEAGLVALDAWSARNPAYDAEETRKRWSHYQSSPPTRTGAGKLWAMARSAVPGWELPTKQQGAAGLSAPDMTVLRLTRRAPPALPLEVFGPFWRDFILDAAKAAACPPDYVTATLLASASALIGNARWAQVSPGWIEPPHLWMCCVGDSGGGKSPGADTLMRDVLPRLEKRMAANFPSLHKAWELESEKHKAEMEAWQKAVRSSKGDASPLPPGEPPIEPQEPRLRLNDVTIEKAAALLANASPKGLLIVRDELAGFLLGMSNYNDTGRQFWIEAYGGRLYRVERQKSPRPIVVERLAVAVFGGTQPAKLVELMKEPDDGLLARLCWFWPDPVPFDISQTAPGAEAAIAALDRLRQLELVPSTSPEDPMRPVFVPMTAAAQGVMLEFARAMLIRQGEVGGLMVSALGKARGLALRLALVLEYLWWCAQSGNGGPPIQISEKATNAACWLVGDYLMPMAERVFGDAATTPVDRNTMTLARWIIKKRPDVVNARDLHKVTRLPGLGDYPNFCVRGAVTRVSRGDV